MSVTVPFPVDPPGIDAAGKGAVLFVPAIADLAKPTLTELGAALANLSCLIYGWNPNGEQGSTERAKYCSVGTTEKPGKVKWQADNIEYDYDPQHITADGDYGHYAKLAPGTKGFIVDRRGIDARAKWEVGQIVDVYPVELGVQNRIQIDPKAEGETLRISQKIAIYSDPKLDATIAA